MGTHLAIPHTTTLYNSYGYKQKNNYQYRNWKELNFTNVKFDFKLKDDIKKFFKLMVFKTTKRNKIYWNNLKELKDMNWYEPKVRFKNQIQIFHKS